MSWKLKPEFREKHPKVAKCIETALNRGKSEEEAVDEAMAKYRPAIDRETVREKLKR